MAVRFLPPPEEPRGTAREDRADLAEVIELRSRLVQQPWGQGSNVGGAREADARSIDAEATAGIPATATDADITAAEGGCGVSPETAQEAQNAGANEHTGSWLSDAEADGEPQCDEPPAPHPVRALRAVARLPRREPAPGEPLAGSGLESSPSARGARAEAGPRFSPDASPRRVRSEAKSPDSEPGYFEEVDVAREACNAAGVKLMARKARSSGELREELLRLDHEVHVVEEVIAEFEQSLYLDDAGLARTVTEKLRSSKKASRSQIRIKLRERRLPDAVIEAAVSELDADEEFDLLREAAQDRARKMDGLDRQTAERRLLGFLARRGWSGEPATRAVREALDGGSSSNSFSARGSRGGPRFQ